MPRLLDLFCGAGGAAMGYHRAGFDVTGVDVKPQPRYPFTFVQGDALEYLAAHGPKYHVIHASPPCQAFTQMSAKYRGKGGRADSHQDLLTPTRKALHATRRTLWVIENVPGAKRKMSCSLVLHGGLFGLTSLHRPRLFESNVLIPTPFGERTRAPLGVYGRAPDGRTLWRYRNNTTIGRSGRYTTKFLMRAPSSLEEAQLAMGIDWMEWDELKEAIPPAYTEWIGLALIRAIEHAA